MTQAGPPMFETVFGRRSGGEDANNRHTIGQIAPKQRGGSMASYNAIKAMRLLAVTALFLISAAPILQAQRAEPLRVEFKSGSHSAIVRGHLRGAEQMEYVLEMRKGKQVTLRLASEFAGTLKIRLRNPQNAEVLLRGAGPQRWTATPAETGDYEIWVVRVSSMAGETSYKLTITIP